MKVIEIRSEMLDNCQVLEHVKEVQERNLSNPEYTKHDPGRSRDGRETVFYTGKLRDLHFILDDVTRYLESSEATKATFEKSRNKATDNKSLEFTAADESSTGAIESTSGAAGWSQQLQRFFESEKTNSQKLTKTELLMLVNLMPENLEQLEPIIEDIGERFSETEQLEIVTSVAEVFGGKSTVND